MAKNPQEQTQQAQQPAQQPQPLPQHYVVEYNSGQPQAAEQVQSNGAGHANPFQMPVQQTQQAQAQQQVKMLQPKPIKPGQLDPAALDFYATVVEDKNPALAAALRAQKHEAGMGAGFKRTMSHRITIGDVLIVAGVIVAVTLIWEGVAYKFDLPRLGLFDPSNPLKAAGLKK